MNLSDEQTTSDDGFGEVVILTSQPRPRRFAVSGSASVSYTNNAALTSDQTIDDTFFVANAGFSWTPIFTPHLNLQFAAQGSLFRYDKTPALDFQSITLGAGLFWNPECWPGVGFFSRYDFIEMFDRHSQEILRDHSFTLGAQREFRLGRIHDLVVGASIVSEITEPESAQHNQAGLFFAYRVEMNRSLGVDLFYRLGGQFYGSPSHNDFNQILSLNARYRVWESAQINAFLSLTDNRSENSVFDYTALSSGGGISAIIQF